MERYRSRVYRLAYGITRNEADAQEVAQDVFLNIFRKIQTFEGRARLGSWIYRIAANAALIKRRRKQGRGGPGSAGRGGTLALREQLTGDLRGERRNPSGGGAS